MLIKKSSDFLIDYICDPLQQKISYGPCFKLLVWYKYNSDLKARNSLFKSSGSWNIRMYAMTQPLLIMPCTDKVVNGWSTVLFWIEWVMVWRALMFDSFVPKWPNQSCASSFIIEGLLMFKWESTTFCCNASHIFLEDNAIGYTTNAAWIGNGLPNPILHTCVWNWHMLDWRQQYEEVYTTIKKKDWSYDGHVFL